MLVNLDVKTGNGKNLVRNCVYFIRNYADRYHHAKEEEILFKYFDEDLDILKVMYDDHGNARAHVRAVLDGLEHEDGEAVSRQLDAYRGLLTEHIKKEDEILYPWMDRNLSDRQIGEMFARFNEAGVSYAGKAIERCERIVEELDARLGGLRAQVKR